MGEDMWTKGEGMWVRVRACRGHVGGGGYEGEGGHEGKGGQEGEGGHGGEGGYETGRGRS